MTILQEYNKIPPPCPVCGTTLKAISGDYFMCHKCRYMCSNQISGAGAEVEGIEDVRKKNFRAICDKIKKDFPRCKSILDVGSAHGFFIETAQEYNFAITGIEPDGENVEKTRKTGAEVIQGYFPGAPALEGRTFDVIIFNNSFEHIPDLTSLLEGIKKHLNRAGAVIVNLPSSGGLVFNIAFLLYKAGIKAPFDRLWQKGFASPHIHYFNAKNLSLLFVKHSFKTLSASTLPMYTLKGLWRRIRCKSSFFVSAVSWFVMVVFYPLFSLKSDKASLFFESENYGAAA